MTSHRKRCPSLFWLVLGCLVGSWIALSVPSLDAAQLKTFVSEGQVVRAVEVGAEVRPVLRAMRFNEASEEWNLDVVVTNSGLRRFPLPLFLVVEVGGNTTGLKNSTGTLSETPALPFIAIPPGGPSVVYVLEAGQMMKAATLRLGFRDGPGAPTVAVRVFGNPEGEAPLALALTRVLEQNGQPLLGVRVVESGPEGTRELRTDATAGVVTLGQDQGRHIWRFEMDGFFPAWRTADLAAGRVELVPNPRLISRPKSGTSIGPLGGELRVGEKVRIQIGPGILTQASVESIALIDPQSLPAPLPVGWSPLSGFWWSSSISGPQPTKVILLPDAPLLAGDSSALCRWNETSLVWEVIQLVGSKGTAPIEANLPGPGAFVLVVGDAGTLAPPIARLGEALPGSGKPGPSVASLSAVGTASPSAATASLVPDQVTALASVTLTSSNSPIPSGHLLRGEVRESYVMQDGSSRFVPAYEQYLLGYQRPGDTSNSTVQLSFPMRPLLLFGSQELREARVGVDVLSPSSFEGQIFRPSGGVLSAGTISLSAAAGAAARPQAAILTPLPGGKFDALLSAGFAGAIAFDLLVAELEPGAHLVLQVSKLQPRRQFVLARVITRLGLSGLEPVERFQTGSNGALESLEPSTGGRLPGLRVAGQYVLIQVESASALVSGLVRDGSGKPAAGVPVRLRGLPWFTFSLSDGSYQLIAPPGPAEVTVENPSTRETDLALVTVALGQETRTPDLALADRGPRVVSSVPADGAERVAALTPISLTFNEALDPATLSPEAVRLARADGSVLASTLGLSLRGTVVNVQPSEPLPAGETLRLVINPAVRDRSGKTVEGSLEIRFTTQSQVARGELARLTVFEPGATNLSLPSGVDVRRLIPAFDLIPDRQSSVVAYGSPGTADGRVPVILANETTGETSTVLSAGDGSFAGLVAAALEDFVTATFVNANGTRTTVAATRQIFDDGRVGLYRGGGILEAESDGGAVQILVEPGAVDTRTELKLETIPLTELLTLVEGQQPIGGRLVGGFRYQESGNDLKSSVDVSFPVKVSDLGLPPGVAPESRRYALVVPAKYDDTVVYEVLDTMEFEASGAAGSGRLVTHSPPFPGLLARKLAQVRSAIRRVDRLGLVKTTEVSPGKQAVSTGVGVVTLDQPASQGAKIAGHVRSAILDSKGSPTSELRPVPGAIVVAEEQGTQRPKGFLRPGELVVTTDAQGAFAIFLRPSEQSQTRELLASHPRFPFQVARAGVLLDPKNTAVGVAELRFAEAVGITPGVEGSTPAVVRGSHFPLLPSAGAGPTDGTVLTVVAIDDFDVSRPSLALVNAETPAGVPLDPQQVVTITEEAELRASASSTVQGFRIQAKVAAKVKLRATVLDDLGTETVLDYTLQFGLSASELPSDPAGHPSVVLAWPPNGADRVPSLTPVLLRFSRPVAESLITGGNITWVTLDDDHRLTSLRASPDRREVTIFYDGSPNGDVRLTVNTIVDQDPSSNGNQAFTVKFTQSGQRQGSLDEGETGGGVVIQGRFAYSLDRKGSGGGRLLSFDLANPQEPEELDALSLTQRPATLALIPDYALPQVALDASGRPVSTGCEPTSLLAVFSGGASELKRLHLVRLRSDSPGTFEPNPASVVLSRSESSQIVKSHWDPPFLGYLELDSQVTSLTLLDLVSLQVATRLSRTELDRLPPEGDAGLDANGDGDYCDAGDRLPIPLQDSVHPAGLSFSFAPENPKERIQDFDYLSDIGLVGAVTTFSDRSQSNRFRIVLAARVNGPVDDAIVHFPTSRLPKRLSLLRSVVLQTPTNRVVKDLAIVSLAREDGTDGSLAVIDVTNPGQPRGIAEIPLPTGEGQPQTIFRRTDGLLSLATTRSIFLLDPTQFGMPVSGGRHPAFVQRIELAAGGVRDFASDPSGLNAVFQGGVKSVVQVEPRFQVVVFDRDPLSPTNLVQLPPTAVNAILAKARSVGVVEPSSVDSAGEVIADLAPNRHHYVLVDAPGSAGGDSGLLPIVVAAVNRNGSLYERNNRNPAPSIIGDRSVQNALFLKQLLKITRAAAKALDVGETTGQEISGTDLFISLLKNPRARAMLPDLKAFARMWASFGPEFNARRLSDQPTSPLYNRFLAGPFLVLPKSPEESVVKELKLQAEQRSLGRAYLRASPQLWVGLQKDFRKNPVLGQYASVFTIGSEVTLASQRLPVLSRLGELLLDYLGQDHDIVAPVLLEGLQLALRAVTEIPLVNQIGIDYRPNLLPGASLLKPVAYVDRPLLFVPGFGGSRLQNANGEIWPSILGLRQDDSVLQVKPNGGLFEKQVAGDALRFVVEAGPIHLMNIYGVTLDQLKDDLGYTEYDFIHPTIPGDKLLEIQSQRRDLRGRPILNQEPAPDLFVFGYDWRLDNAKAAAELNRYVELMRFYHPEADGIDVIAHSNGNLVARKYILDHPGVVKRYLTLAAPFLGSGKPILGMLTGDMQDIGLNLGAPIGAMRRAMQFMPGAHQLICNRGIFELGAFPIEESGYDLNRDGNAFERYTYPQFAEAMEKFLFKESHAELFHTQPSPSRLNHEQFHRPAERLPIADWSHDDASIELHHIIGMQTVTRSPLGTRLVGRLHSNRTNFNNISLDLPSLQRSNPDEGPDGNRAIAAADGDLGITTNQFRFRGDLELIKTLGDGTVPILSLSRGYGSPLSMNAAHAKLYCVVSPSPDRDELSGHNPMLVNPLVQTWIRRIMEGRKVSVLEPQVGAPALVGEGREFTLTVSPGPSTGVAATGRITTLIDFGDGASSSRVGAGASARHRYRQDGVYVVSVGVTGENGVSGFTSQVITVTNIAPVVKFNPTNTTIALNSTILFSVKVTDLGVDDRHTFTWSLDGQTLSGRNGPAAFVNLSSLGEHRLRVEAADADGGSHGDELTLHVIGTEVPPAPVPSLADTGDTVTTTPFEQQPTALLRITGQKPGPFDTLGVVVSERGSVTFKNISVPVPVLAIPILGNAIAQFIGSVELANRLTRYVARVRTALIDSIVQRNAADSTLVELVQVINEQKGAALRSTVEVEALGGPLELELLYSQGGIPVQFTRWTTNVASNAPVSLDLVWQDANGTPQADVSLKVGGELVAKRYEALGPSAGDRQPPAVAALFNPATGNVHLVAHDNVTPADRIELLLVQDASGDGRLEDEVFYLLGTNVLSRARLPSRKFAIVGRDEVGNVSELEPFVIQGASDFTIANVGDGGYCSDLSEITSAIKETIQIGLDSEAVHDLFLLDPSHLWIFEQGSGACLWKEDTCFACNGNFIPGVSDNDYELFFPVHLGRNFDPLNETDRLEFLGQDPHSFTSRKGDWYFRPPEGVDENGEPVSDRSVTKFWRYALPEGFVSPLGQTEILIPNQASSGNLALGFDLPLVPAEIISRTLTRVIKDEARLGAILSETTFFPARREHFVYGKLDLELPPEDGPDTLGDGGCGRGLLLLKWALEGEFVDLPASMGVNRDLPPLDLVYENLRRVGIPAAEGFEWGIFQEFAAVKGGVTLDLHATYGPDEHPQALHSAAGNELETAQKKKLKKLGKSAIRSAIARVAADSDASSLVFAVNRQTYAARRLASFEDFILNVITNNADVGERLFPGLLKDRAPEEGPDLIDFLRAKKADEEFFERLLRDPDGCRRFVLGGFRFLRENVQAPSRPFYEHYLETLSQTGQQAELQQREANMEAVVEGNPPARKGLRDLVQNPPSTPVRISVSLANYNGDSVSARTVKARPGKPRPTPQGDPPEDVTQEIPISVLVPGSQQASGDDFDEPTVEIPVPLIGSDEPTLVDIRVQTDPGFDYAIEDDDILVVENVISPELNPNLPKPHLRVLVDFLKERDGFYVRFRGAQPDGSVVSPAPRIEIGFTPPGSSTRSVLGVDRFKLGLLPPELRGVLDIEVSAIPTSTAFAPGRIPMVTTLTPLFRDGIRFPTPGEVRFLDALKAQYPLVNKVDDATEYLNLMVVFMDPLWNEIVQAPALAGIEALAGAFHFRFATAEQGCRDIKKYLAIGPAVGGKIDFNPGRQLLANRRKTGVEGVIYLNEELRLPGTIRIINGGPVSRVDVIRVELVHELNVRSVKLVRDDYARTGTLKIFSIPIEAEEHQLLDVIADNVFTVLGATAAAYPLKAQAVDPERKCP